MNSKKNLRQSRLPPAERQAYRSWRDHPSGYPEKEIPASGPLKEGKAPIVTRRKPANTLSPRSGGSASLYDDDGIRYDVDD